MGNVVALPKRAEQLQCLGCGIVIEAGCNCNVGYAPPGARAALAVAANPSKSDRAIAANIGVGKNTVARAREQTGPHGPVAKRTGRDGKARKMPKPNKNGFGAGSTTASAQDYATAFWGRFDLGMRYALIPQGWPPGVVTEEMVRAAEAASKAWAEVAKALKRLLKQERKNG